MRTLRTICNINFLFFSFEAISIWKAHRKKPAIISAEMTPTHTASDDRPLSCIAVHRAAMTEGS